MSFRLVLEVADDVMVASRPVDDDGKSTVVVLVGELSAVSSDIG